MVFSWVRAPLDKFLSGIGEVQLQHNSTWQRQVETFLRSGTGNEHLVSNMDRLLGADRHGRTLPYSFIGRFEQFDSDLAMLAGLLGGRLNATERALFLQAEPTNASLATRRRRAGASPAAAKSPGRNISSWLHQFCSLSRTRADFECLHYVRPDTCR